MPLVCVCFVCKVLAFLVWTSPKVYLVFLVGSFWGLLKVRRFALRKVHQFPLPFSPLSPTLAHLRALAMHTPGYARIRVRVCTHAHYARTRAKGIRSGFYAILFKVYIFLGNIAEGIAYVKKPFNLWLNEKKQPLKTSNDEHFTTLQHAFTRRLH